METLEAYLDRKHEELTLLNGFLGTPLALRHPVSVVDVIEQKFHVAAALKAEHALHDWALTETAWAHQGRLRAGPFEFSYDYQRADLEVRGPSFYQFDSSAAANETIYTSSGMAAISALLLASVRLMSEADILALPGSYGETLELIESHARQLRLVRLKRSRLVPADCGFFCSIHVRRPPHSRRPCIVQDRISISSFSIRLASQAARGESAGF